MEKLYNLYNGEIELKFKENPYHQFYVRKKGEEKWNRVKLSTTGATGIIDKSRPLIYWATNLARDYLLGKIKKGAITESDIYEAVKQHTIRKEKAADIGTLIHEWCSSWILGKKPEMPENEKVVNGITSFLKFQKEHKVKWTESERAVYSKKYNFAGFLDAMGKIGKENWLIDFKSSKAVYPEMKLQVAGYSIAYEEEMGNIIDRRMILKFGKDTGDFEVHEIPVENHKKDNKAFLSALTLKRRIKELDTYKYKK